MEEEKTRQGSGLLQVSTPDSHGDISINELKHFLNLAPNSFKFSICLCAKMQK